MLRLVIASALGVLALASACGSEGTTERVRDAGGLADTSAGDAPLLIDTGDLGPPGDVEAVVTTDNAFSFGYGNETSIATFVAGGPASNGSEIFDCPVGYGPHAFVVPAKDAPPSAFLYIVAWADEQTTQGVLAQFKRTGGSPVFSGAGSWQVCATGQFFAASGAGPDQAKSNEAIGLCNAGAAGTTYSKGWVNTAGAITAGAVGALAFGEANDDAGGSFPVVCQVDDAGVKGIEPGAKWMWFDPQDSQSPFEGNDGNRTKTFLIFRLPASALTVK